MLGRLHPRERLIEDELMRRFGVKRHVVRRGLADLERMGVVERVPNRGAMVRAYRADESSSSTCSGICWRVTPPV